MGLAKRRRTRAAMVAHAVGAGLASRLVPASVAAGVVAGGGRPAVGRPLHARGPFAEAASEVAEGPILGAEQVAAAVVAIGAGPCAR